MQQPSSTHSHNATAFISPFTQCNSLNQPIHTMQQPSSTHSHNATAFISPFTQCNSLNQPIHTMQQPSSTHSHNATALINSFIQCNNLHQAIHTTFIETICLHIMGIAEAETTTGLKHIHTHPLVNPYTGNMTIKSLPHREQIDVNTVH